MLHPGLYEQVINKSVNEELTNVPDKCKAVETMDKAEASKIIAQYLSGVIQEGLDNILDKNEGLSSQIELANKIVNLVKDSTDESYFAKFNIDSKAQQLLALLDEKDPLLATNKTAKDIDRPETSIAQSSLFTGSQNEPQMYTELKKEINSSDHIDMLVSFIKWSGLRLIMEELERFTKKGGTLRIITTSYMGATDAKAVEELNKLPNTRIRISYDTKRTRLHAKTYVFHRNTGFTTAYVGSSNLSNAAISSGLEWNVKITKTDQGDTINKINATFESYWNSNEFENYSEAERGKLECALKKEKYNDGDNSEIYTMDVTPYSYQQEILDKLEAERKVKGYTKNLVVAATGTGKTVVSALDYKRFRKENPERPCRLMFVAHREEILKQSINTFRAVLKDANFGEMFVGSHRPTSIENLFISIQTFNSQDFTSKTTTDFYDYIVVDEFHHAAAPTYKKLLSYYRPQIMLGLTATPERMDGQRILPFFDNRIAAEIRLPEAIDRKLLCPFQYFGVTDTIDLSNLRWTRGGYDNTELSNLYSLSGENARRRADMIISSLMKYTTDINEVKGLGFCVSKDHARFMSKYFNDHGIKSIALLGESPEEERATAKRKLVHENEIHFIFVVDIYNEGVDIPEINTILFLRPTESLTIFLQQLGRGLRLSDGKDCLTVLDFIGQANKKYNFEDKFAALLFNTRHSVEHEIKEGFTSLPKGCYIKLEKIAARHILDNIKASYGNTASLVSRAASFTEDSGMDLTLNNFLKYYHLDPRSMYRYSSFSRLCSKAGKRADFHEPLEELITKSFSKFAVVDSRRWIKFILNILPTIKNIDLNILPPMEKLMTRMLGITIWNTEAESWTDNEVSMRLRSLALNPTMIDELGELLRYQFECIDFVDKPTALGFDCPLDLYCTYSRDQILTAFGFNKPSTMREGVKWLGNKQVDLFLITLNKSDKDYSPSTMYNDYSINENLFHWQSQSTTSENSTTGQRYINHRKLGSKILLFVREFKEDNISKSAAAYTFLGTAEYVTHNGSRPMNITWRLDNPIPAKFLKKTNKLVAS